jgi:hypothetical protein
LLRFLEINTIIPAKSRLAVIKILSQIVLADLISPSSAFLSTSYSSLMVSVTAMSRIRLAGA